jgi:uncharacterized membrane protein YjdF
MASLSNTHKWVLAGINAAYIAAFAMYYIAIRDYEFLWYIAVMIFFFGLIFSTVNRSHFSPLILWGLSLWGFMHMAGGGIKVGDGVLYSYQIFHIVGSGEAFVLKYDQVVHAFGFFMATLVVLHLLRPYLNEKANWKVVYPVAIAAGMGLGALNEIVEFIAVLSFPGTGVGGYYNTAIDLCANGIGATLAAVYHRFLLRRGE